MAQTKTNNTPPHTDTHLQPPTRCCWKPVVVVTACKGRCRQEQNTRECARETNNSFGQQQKITQRCTSRDEMHYCTHVETLHVCVYDEDGLEGFSDSFFLLFCSPPSCHPWILAHHIYTSEYRANSNSQKKKKQKKKQVESPTAYHPETVTAWWEYENGTVPFGKRHKIPAKQNRNKNVKNGRKIKMATSLKLISVILYTPLPHRPPQPSSTASFDQHGYIVLYNASYRCNCVMKCPPNSIFFSSQFCCCCFFFITRLHMARQPTHDVRHDPQHILLLHSTCYGVP